MKEWPGVYYMFTKINLRVPDDRSLMAIGYTYNYTTFLGFIATEGSESIEPADPYLSRFLDN